MPTPAQKLAEALEALQAIQAKGMHAITPSEMTRTHRERLLKNGFLQEVIKGWYIPSHPDNLPGDSTAWYTAYWPFCANYLNHRFKDNWCLSPEQSLLLHAGNWTIPKQLLVRSPKGNNKITALPFNTSLFDVRYPLPDPQMISKTGELNVYKAEFALISCSPKFFIQHPGDVRAILLAVQDPSLILNILLDEGRSTIAGRLAGAFINVGNTRIADEITKTMTAAGYNVRVTDPFKEQTIVKIRQTKSPYVNRLHMMWQEMRHTVIKHLSPAPGLPENTKKYLAQIEENYANDAYNSLSIEGYKVSLELIEKVRHGKWNPESNKEDHEHKNALAARGYWQAFQEVKASVDKVLHGKNAGGIAQKDHNAWYRELFGLCATAGIIKPSDLAGYRNGPVYIRNSMHVPPNREAVRELMPTFFQLLKKEEDPAVRSVLGHFFFVYIHPYMDGNGRMGRFLMNVMFASGGYPWVIIPVEKRTEYMKCLEAASVDQNIKPFCQFIAGLI